MAGTTKKFLQSEKTIKKLTSEDGIKREDIPVIEWDSEELTRNNKVTVFQNYYPREEMINANRSVYHLGKVGDGEVQFLRWVNLSERYVQEYFYWLVIEALERDTDYLSKLFNDIEQVAKEKANKEMEEYLEQLAYRKWQTLPRDTEYDFDDIKETIRKSLEEVEE